jgi:hypothetical protein
MQSVESQPNIRRNISVYFSWLKSKVEEPPFCPLHVGFLLGLLFNPDDGGDIFPQEVD